MRYRWLQGSRKGKKDKERAIQKLKEKIPPEKRSVFCELVEAARYVDIFSEEHNVYCEFPNDSVRRLYILEAGRRLVNEGVIEKVDDVFMLWIDEIKKVLYHPKPYRLQRIAAESREKGENTLKNPIPPVLSKSMTPQQAFEFMMKSKDPILIHTIVGEIPEQKPEVKADLIGIGGAPGVAEGVAKGYLQT